MICNLRNLIINTVLIFLTTLSVSAFGAEKPAKYEEGKLYRHTLENGLTVLTIERHIAPLIYHQLTYKVGSRNERLGITGISHVVEHLMFKGTPKYAKGEASKTISNNSGIFNAFTANDMTSYYEYLPKNKVEIAMDIESDRMQNSIFNHDEFESEIEVIKQERRMRSESQANGIFSETMNSVAYTSHQNRDPIIGWPSDLDHMTRDEAYNYYKTYYTPNNAFLVLIGDFNTDEILQTVKKYYEKIPSGPEVQEMWSLDQPQRVRKEFTLYHSDYTQPGFRMAFHAPLYSDPDAAALRVAGMILAEKSRDARLYKRLVENDQIAISVAGGFGMTKDPGLFGISVSIKPDSSIDKVEQIIWEEIKLMQTEPVTDHEIQKIKNRYLFNQLTSYTKNADIGSRISRYEAFFGYDFLAEFDQRVINVTKDDILGVMNKYFAPDKVTIGFSMPKEGSTTKKINIEDENIPAGSQNKSEGIDVNYFQPPMEAVVINDKSGTAVDEEIIKPKPIAPMVKTMKLDNGITLYTIEDHFTPAISIIGTVETGLINESLEGQQPGIATFLGDLMNRGSENMEYTELSERMAFVPFSFSISGSYRSFMFQGYSLIKDSDEMMKTGFELVTKPGLKEEQIEKIRPFHIISARNRLKKTSVKAFYSMFNTIFNGHTFTKYNSTEESIKGIKKEDLAALYKKYFQPQRISLLMIGDMKPEEMLALANKYYGQWEKAPDEIVTAEVEAVEEYDQRIVKVFPEKDYTECTINIGFAPYNKISADEEEIVSVLNYILAQSSLTSRMGVELRDKQGLVYGIKSELWYKTDRIGYWKFNTKTGPKNVEKVITGIFKEIKKLLDEGITDEELKAAKQRQLGLLPFYVETPDDAGQIVFNAIREKEALDHFDKKTDRILAVTKDDVLRLAKKYFTLDKYFIVVDGPIEENSLDHLLNEL